MKKKLISFALALALCLGLAPSALASHHGTSIPSIVVPNENIEITNCVPDGEGSRSYTGTAPVTITPDPSVFSDVTWSIAIIPKDVDSVDEFDWETYSDYTGTSLTLTEPGNYQVLLFDSGDDWIGDFWVTVLAAEPSANENDKVEAPETVTITGVTVQEAPALLASGFWVKRVYCESGATVSLKTSYTDSETGEETAIGDVWISKVDSIEVFYIDPYLCADIEENEAEYRSLKPGDGAFPLEDGEWLIEVMREDNEGAHFPVEHIYVKAGGSSAPSVRFTDVPDGAWYTEAVYWAADQNITNGTGADTFSPEKTCTRGEILTFLWRASGSPDPVASNPFTDIQPSDFYYKAALWAAEKGLISEAVFGANTDCTRSSTVEYMWKTAGSPAASYDGRFTDVAANADYAQAVAWALEKSVTSGTSATTFSPDNTCTRSQIATFLYRAFAQ